MRSARRKKEIQRRKNFLPSLIVTILLWILLSGFIYFVDPDSLAAVPVFFLLEFVTLLFTTSILFGNTRRGAIATLVITVFLILRYFGVGNLLNLLLLVGVGITIEVYFSKNS